MRDYPSFDTTFSGFAVADNFQNFTNEHQYIPRKNQQSVRHTSCYFVSPVLKNTKQKHSRMKEREGCVYVFVCVCRMLASSSIDSHVSDWLQ